VSDALLDGRPCATDVAVEAAARLLCAARAPLVWGLVLSTVEAQREAVGIASLLGACIDSAASPAHAASSAAFEQLGQLTASLGEIRRADLVVFWGCDPDQRHPGFAVRHAPRREGMARLAIDLDAARGPAQVEERLALPSTREVECLLVLRAFVRGRRIEAERAQGLPLEALRHLARRLSGCRYGIVLYDADPPLLRREPERAHALTVLVRDARAKARLRLIGVRSAGNPVGAENVLAWQAGFPAAVSFARGDPRYGPGEFTGECLLRREEVDAALLVGAEPAGHLSDEARSHLGRIPSVRLGPVAVEGHRVFIPTARLADTAGTVFRMDGIALRQRALEPGALPSEAAILSRIASVIRAQGERA
jgi:formylmethanofuran dehydrogenase subunit B